MGTVTTLIGNLQKRKYTEPELIEGLKNDNTKVIKYFLKQNVQVGLKIINKYSFGIGKHLEQEDILMEAFETLVDNIKHAKFDGLAKVNTYFIRICINKCLDYSKKNKKISINYGIDINANDINFVNDSDHQSPVEDQYDPIQRMKVLTDIVGTMDEICIELFDLRFGLSDREHGFLTTGKKRGYEEIATLMSMNEAYARKKYSRCLSYLWGEYKRRITSLD